MHWNSWILLLIFLLERRYRERSGESGGGTKQNIAGTLVLDGDIRNGDPDEELLALHTGQMLHLTVLHERRHLRVVPDAPPDRAEHVRLALLLPQPHESGGLVVADLDEVVEREQAFRHVDFLQQIERFLLAHGGAGVNLGVLAVGFD